MAFFIYIFYLLHIFNVHSQRISIYRVCTGHGLTRSLNIKDSIRQGGVLSVIEYDNLIDEIAKELEYRHEGHQ